MSRDCLPLFFLSHESKPPGPPDNRLKNGLASTFVSVAKSAKLTTPRAVLHSAEFSVLKFVLASVSLTLKGTYSKISSLSVPPYSYDLYDFQICVSLHRFPVSKSPVPKHGWVRYSIIASRQSFSRPSKKYHRSSNSLQSTGLFCIVYGNSCSQHSNSPFS